jgi:16S rRNA (guanine966-N2)-methyltransferase
MASRGKTRAGRGAVRIIGGRWRRRRIPVPAAGELRPTPDRVRETVFNWLDPFLPGAVCLDLFAGTGVLGFESLSRGAGRAVLVERDPRLAAALEGLRDTLGADAEVVCADALVYLGRRLPEPFDLVFVDPPYAEPVGPVFQALRPWLRPGARVYLERERSGPWPEPASFDWQHRSTAGGIAFGVATFSAE